MPARRKVAMLILVVLVFFEVSSYTFADVVSINVSVSESATLTFPDSLDSTAISNQVSDMQVKSNAYWQLMLNEKNKNEANTIRAGNNIEMLSSEELELKPGRHYIITVMQ